MGCEHCCSTSTRRHPPPAGQTGASRVRSMWMSPSNSPARLDAALLQAEREGYDVVVLDTAPHADQAALRVARLADLVLVPVRPSILDLDAMGASLDLCALARRPAAVVLNAAPIRSRVVQEAVEAVAKLGGDVFRHDHPRARGAAAFPGRWTGCPRIRARRRGGGGSNRPLHGNMQTR